MKRWETILLLLSKQDYVTANYLAEKLDVSSRTVRNDIMLLNKDLSAFGAEIIAKPRRGYLLHVDDAEAYSTFINMLQKQALFSDENRVPQLIEYLLTASDAVKIDDLCDIFFASRSSIKLDLREVRKTFKKFGIELDYRANQGLKVIGNEKQIRLCLARVKMENAFALNLNNDVLNTIKRIIQRQVEKCQFGISDFSIENLAIHINVAIQRIKSGRIMEMDRVPQLDSHDNDDLEMTLAIIDDLETVFGVKFSQVEIHYILLQFSSKKIISLDRIGQNTVVSDDIYKMVLSMLEQINRVFKIDLRYDLELVTLLSLHLVSFQVRLLHDFSSYNPLMDDIRHHYILAYHMATIACDILEEKYHKKIVLDEIAYMALHFNVALERKRRKKKENVLIVCGEGRANMELLVYQVRQYFSDQLSIVGTINLFQLDKIDFDNVDYVLSTETITSPIPVPIIEIKSLIAEQAVEEVNQQLKTVHGSQFVQFFTEDLFFKSVAQQKKEDILSFLCQAISSKISLPEDFYQSVLEREALGRTSFGNFVAIPHPLKPMGKESFIAIGILDEKVIWDEEEVQLVFLLSMKENGDDHLQDLYKVLSKIISQRTFVQQIIKSGDFAEFKDIITKIVEGMD